MAEVDISQFIKPHTEAWYAARRERLTSSEIHKIFVSGQKKGQLIGQGGMTYVNKIIAQILTGEVKETPETPAILWGLTEEHDAKLKYQIKTNQIVEDSFFVAYSTILGGTNDGYVKENNKLKSIIEIKNPDSAKHIQILRCLDWSDLKDVDAQYYHQPQANMMFCDAEYCDFISHDSRIKYPDLQLKIMRIYPSMFWRREFTERIDFVADYMNETLQRALQTPELNEAFRVADKIKAIDNLVNAMESVKQIAK
jgi:hypothetical protein